MANLRLSSRGQQIMLDALLSDIDGGYIRFYGGTQPLDPSVDPNPQTQPLLATMRWNADAFTYPDATGHATVNTIAVVTASADGTCQWARAFKADGSTRVFDCDVGTSGASINLNTTVFKANAVVSITGGTATMPAAA